jgi:flavodoxin
MYSVLILWAPDTAENRRVVEAVVAAFESRKLPTLAKKASEATIADINIADMILFGAQKSGPAEVPSDYSELLRVFKGITLAGKVAGFFSLGQEKAISRIRKALKDTEVLQSEEDPLLSEQKPGSALEISEWVKRLARLLQGTQSAHG